MNWKKGDIAICVKTGLLTHQHTMKNPPPPLRLYSEYIVQNVYTCPKCNDVSLDVGLSSSTDSTVGTQCCSETIPCKEIHWCASERFVKKETKSLEEQIAEAIEKEDYELADKLKAKLINV